MTSGHSLNLDGTGTNDLVTVGTSSASPTPGSWNAIDFEKGSTGSITYAVVKDGGYSSTDNYGENVQASIVIEGVNVSISNTQIADAYADGIDVTTGGLSSTGNIAPSLTNDKFTMTSGNTNNGVAVQYNFVPVLTQTVNSTTTDLVSGLTSSGYGNNDIQIDPGTYKGTGAWPNAGIPYLLGTGGSPLSISSGASLSIAPSDTIFMSNNTSILVLNGGSLTFSGASTQGAGISVGSATDVPGNWEMIDYQKGSSGSIAYTHFKDGGYNGTDGNGDTIQATIVVEGVDIPISHSAVANSYANGIEITQNGNPTLTADNFTFGGCNNCSNTGYAVQYDTVPGDLAGSISGLTSSGYGNNVVHIDPSSLNGMNAGIYSGTGSWPQAGIPYLVDRNVDITASSSLTIPAGVELLMGDEVSLFNLGKLVIAGTASSPVTIASHNELPGSSSPACPWRLERDRLSTEQYRVGDPRKDQGRRLLVLGSHGVL